MLKKSIVIILCLSIMASLILPMSVFAEELFKPTSLEAPTSISCSFISSSIFIRFTEPASVHELINMDNGGNSKLLALVDYKKNNGEWTLGDKDFSENTNSITSITETKKWVTRLSNTQHDINNTTDAWYIARTLGEPENKYDFKNNTYYFRVRFVYETYEGKSGYSRVYSPYSAVAGYGKDAKPNMPASLEAPQNLKGELLTDKDGRPYFALNWDIPASISEGNKAVKISHNIDWKVGNGTWASETKNMNEYHAGSGLLTNKDTCNPLNKGGIGEVDIQANVYYFRAYFIYTYDGVTVKSPYSNVFSIGTPSFTASAWAVNDIKKANDYGLVTEKLDAADPKGPITREEFSEIAIRLYEKVTGKAATYDNLTEFSDTKNPEIYKAFKLEIVKGIGGGKFAPDELVTREQIAAMMQRAVKAMKPDADQSTDGAEAFKDEKDISKWALDSVKFMSKQGLLKGANGKFGPKDSTTREQGIVIVVRTYDKYSDK
ncbi:MAG: S-layer homology domain-containing protein [Clostridiaceae bacterium]|nr:S-layer homology domain-containing protein [Clostridiaceae bacterium]